MFSIKEKSAEFECDIPPVEWQWMLELSSRVRRKLKVTYVVLQKTGENSMDRASKERDSLKENVKNTPPPKKTNLYLQKAAEISWKLNDERELNLRKPY